MSLTPSGADSILAGQPSPALKLRARIWAVCFAIFAFEIGIFLTVFPWMDSWKLNHFPVFVPALVDIWEDPYLRGAVSGVGLINLWISAGQIISLLSRRK